MSLGEQDYVCEQLSEDIPGERKKIQLKMLRQEHTVVYRSNVLCWCQHCGNKDGQ